MLNIVKKGVGILRTYAAVNQRHVCNPQRTAASPVIPPHISQKSPTPQSPGVTCGLSCLLCQCSPTAHFPLHWMLQVVSMCPADIWPAHISKHVPVDEDNVGLPALADSHIIFIKTHFQCWKSHFDTRQQSIWDNTWREARIFSWYYRSITKKRSAKEK